MKPIMKFRDNVAPEVDGKGVPWCKENCPSHDGKRCKLLGHRPDSVCVPAVQDMATEIKAVTNS